MLIGQNFTNVDHIIKIYGCLMQKEWINIDLNVGPNRYNKMVTDFILGLHDVWKVPRVCF